MRNIFLALILLFSTKLSAQKFPSILFEQTAGRESPDYPGIIRWWQAMDAASPYVQLRTMGPSDAGFPLHLVLVSADKKFDIQAMKDQKKLIILVNNGIHPGEPDGIDASMVMVRDLCRALHSTGAGKARLPSNVVLAFIPVYNIGGALNRSPYYRIDQDGPAEKGFRGNSQNLDLNRDFIKADSKEARSFARIFHMLDPDIFIDNHVSNGADYQHVMTLLTTQHNKLGGELGAYLKNVFEPALYASMKTRGEEMVPYVNHFGSQTPDKGWPQFWDSPRYSSGYAALWSSFAFVPETHMLKSYPKRVNVTRMLMESFLEFAAKNSAEIIRLRATAREAYRKQLQFPLGWKLDRSSFIEIPYKGYEPAYRTSNISGQSRLYYDRTKPLNKMIPFYDRYIDTLSIKAPAAYIIPQGWWKVIDRLQDNNVKMKPLQRDTTIEVEAYRLDSYTSGPRPFEGHHPNSSVKITASKRSIRFRKGDLVVSLDQPAARFLVETLEPQGEDSYFTWNFFDPILGQKEGFSDYVFEETAEAYLRQDAALKQKLEQRRATDSVFAKSGSAQLNFIYQNSKYYEPAHLLYPVYRLMPRL